MENQSSFEKKDDRLSKAELLTRIYHSWAELEKTLQALNSRQLTTPGPEKWSVKDHMAHLSVWELGIAELLQHRDRFAAMQVAESDVRSKSDDEVNELIYQQHAHQTLQEVEAEFQEPHRRLLEALTPLSDEDLYRPYAYYVPGSSHAPQGPVINWIVGNTYGHFDEHNQWIKSLVQAIH